MPYRMKRVETYDIIQPTSKFTDKNKKIYEYITPILEKTKSSGNSKTL